MSSTIVLSALPSLLAACVMLAIGSSRGARAAAGALQHSGADRRRSAVRGAGLAAAAGGQASASRAATTTRSTLLLIFFASIGLTADLSLLRRGGPRLVRFLLALFPFLVVQNVLGILMAQPAGVASCAGAGCRQRHPDRRPRHRLGLCRALRRRLRHSGCNGPDHDVGDDRPGDRRRDRRPGGRIADPAAQKTRSPMARESGGVVGGPAKRPVTTSTLTIALAAALAAVIAGQAVADLFAGTSVTVPAFSVVPAHRRPSLRNVVAGHRAAPARRRHRADRLVQPVAVPGRSTMIRSLDLAGVVALAGPLLIILAAQTILGRAVGEASGIPRLRPRLRGGGVGRCLLRLRHGRDGDGDRQHAGGDAALRPGAGILRRRAGRRRLLRRPDDTLPS